MKHTLIAFVGMVLAVLCWSCSNGIPSNAAQLNWDANIETDLAGYKIHYGTASGTYDQVVDAGTTDKPDAPSYVVEDLASGTTYYFVVTAYDLSGNESAYSNEVSKTIQ